MIETRKFGKTDMEVSVLGFGGAEIGFEEAPQTDVDKLLNEALDAGLNVIDTAECYPNSEEKIGRAVAHRRKDFFLFTKCGHFDGRTPDWTKASLLASIERSLKRLQMEYVDLVQLHSCPLEVLQAGEAIEALEEAQRRGYTRYIGYSGDGQAALYAVMCNRFDALEISVNVADQEAIDLVLPRARERQIGVIAKRPVANAAWRYGNSPPSEPYHTVYWERLRQLDYPFTHLPLSEAVAVALRFTLSQPGVHTAIVGTKKPGRWLENAQALKAGPLPPPEIEDIRKRWREVAKPDWVGQT
ncbi:MAG: aldo/keto reductase [Candidatus Sumerlaeaceae bacterium]|nr:aldo/keto reductase [Candidatus Sumerlaeaceae bacterium]